MTFLLAIGRNTTETVACNLGAPDLEEFFSGVLV